MFFYPLGATHEQERGYFWNEYQTERSKIWGRRRNSSKAEKAEFDAETRRVFERFFGRYYKKKVLMREYGIPEQQLHRAPNRGSKNLEINFQEGAVSIVPTVYLQLLTIGVFLALLVYTLIAKDGTFFLLGAGVLILIWFVYLGNYSNGEMSTYPYVRYNNKLLFTNRGGFAGFRILKNEIENLEVDETTITVHKTSGKRVALNYHGVQRVDVELVYRLLKRHLASTDILDHFVVR